MSDTFLIALTKTPDKIKDSQLEYSSPWHRSHGGKAWGDRSHCLWRIEAESHESTSDFLSLFKNKPEVSVHENHHRVILLLYLSLTGNTLRYAQHYLLGNFIIHLLEIFFPYTVFCSWFSLHHLVLDPPYPSNSMPSFSLSLESRKIIKQINQK